MLLWTSAEPERSNDTSIEPCFVMLVLVTIVIVVFLLLTFVAWRRYLWAAEEPPQADTC